MTLYTTNSQIAHQQREMFSLYRCRVEELRWTVTTLMDIARHIKARRTRGGALALEGVEVQVQLDKEKATIEDLIPKQVLLLLCNNIT